MKFSGNKPIITLGTFDGVHSGHKSLIDAVIMKAKSVGGESVAITFDPHPRLTLAEDKQSLNFLTSLEERKYLLNKAGLDKLIIIPFDKKFSQHTTCEFVKEILVDQFNMLHLIIGFNHHFGHKSPDVNETVTDCAMRYGFSFERKEALIDEGTPVSSTRIRNNLLSGELAKGNSLLGYDYFLRGSVIEGKKIGRMMGYPTANIKPEYEFKLIPKDGVYAVEVDLNGKFYGAMLYIGTRPTMEEPGGKRTIEANIFEFDDDIYGSIVRVIFRHRLRDDIKFQNTELLTEQIKLDKEDTLRILSRR